MSPVRALLTDLYELTMADVYHRRGMAGDPATFSVFVRGLPEGYGYMVAAGLDDALGWLEELSFDDESVKALESLGLFDPTFLDWLSGLRFSGSVRAVPEGTILFPGEPLLEVDAPLAEAQLAETFILNCLGTQSALASRAARLRYAARGRTIMDFSLRRTPGIDAAMQVARCCRLVGIDATSNVAAAVRFGMAPSGTMAHSFVQAHRREEDAFRAYAGAFPSSAVLLVDTYDSVQGIEHAIEVARSLREQGLRLHGVRLDSGDLASLAAMARRRLDAAGLQGVSIVATGGLDEHRIDHLVRVKQAPIDAFGVGAMFGATAPLDMVYKLVEVGGRAVRKTAAGKETLPGAKQVWRWAPGGVRDGSGGGARDGSGGGADWPGDVLALACEPQPSENHVPLLELVMRDGSRTPAGVGDLDVARDRFEAHWPGLPSEVLDLCRPAAPAIRVSAAILDLAARFDLERQSLAASEGEGSPSGSPSDGVMFDRSSALIVVDVQNDFANPAGALYVPGGEDVVQAVNALVERALQAGAAVVYTQDQHPPETPHFTSGGGPWPPHCVTGSWGAELHPGLVVRGPIVRKGVNGEDGYSGFSARDPVSGAEVPTELHALLHDRGIKRLIVAGLARDVCVAATARDARRLGYRVMLSLAASRPVELHEGDDRRVLDGLAECGVEIV